MTDDTATGSDLADRIAIADLIHRYCDAVCRRDADAWSATWADDAVWDLGRGEVSGRETIVETWTAAMGRYANVVQNAMNSTAAVDGSRATGRVYVMEHARAADGPAQVLLAWYDDEYVRDQQRGWLFGSRRLRVLYRGPGDLSGPFSIPS